MPFSFKRWAFFGVVPSFILMTHSFEAFSSFPNKLSYKSIQKLHLDNALLEATQNQNTTALVELLKQGANAKVANAQGETPLHLAAQTGNALAITLLLKTGGEINARDKQGATPLHHAAKMGHAHAIEILLMAHADPSLQTYGREGNPGKTPLDYAAEEGKTAVVTLLSPSSQKNVIVK